MPSTEDVRPSQCPDCEVAAAPPGQNLNLHGHGTRERLVLGPISFQAFLAGSPERVTVQIRRYQCQVCETTMTVVPRQVRPHCLYLDLAVVGALALWAHQPFGLDVEAVRNKLSPERSHSFDWRQMRRWAAGAHRLPHLERPAPRGPPDEVAADVEHTEDSDENIDKQKRRTLDRLRILAPAEFDTLRVRLLKVAAIIHQSVRRIHVQVPRCFPAQEAFAWAATHLNRPPPG